MAQKLDPSRATAGEWLVTPTHMIMHGGNRLPTFAVLATGADAACEQFVGRAHPTNGQAEEQALAYEEDAFRLDMPVDGGDLVAWFSEWRADVCRVLETAATDRT